MARQDKDILLKTKLFGFGKKDVMNYIEKIQLENEGLKRQVEDLSAKNNILLKEGAMLRAKLDVAGVSTTPSSSEEPEVEVVENYGTQVQSRVTFENLADLDADPTYELPYETVGRMTTQSASSMKAPSTRHVVSSKNTVTRVGGKTYISSKK